MTVTERAAFSNCESVNEVLFLNENREESSESYQIHESSHLGNPVNGAATGMMACAHRHNRDGSDLVSTVKSESATNKQQYLLSSV